MGSKKGAFANGVVPFNRDGRPPGVPNRINSQIKNHFLELLQNNAVQMQYDLDSLEPRDRLVILIQLAKLILPTPKAEDVSDESKFKPIIIDINQWK